MNKKRNINIFCSYKKIVPIEQLKPNPENPNTHPDKQVEKLAKLIKAHGWRHPITVSNQSGFISSGHCRLLAAQKLGLKEAPVDFQDFKSKAEERAVLIADNIIAEFSEINYQKMSDVITELENKDYPLELTALDEEEIKSRLISADQEAKNLVYREYTTKPYKRTHILISFSPELFIKIQLYLEKIKTVEGIEYEQASN